MTRSECDCRKELKDFFNEFRKSRHLGCTVYCVHFFSMTQGFIFEWKRVNSTMQQTFSESAPDSRNWTVKFVVDFAIQRSVFRI